MTTTNSVRRATPSRLRRTVPWMTLLACVPLWLALAGVWARSYWVGDSFWWNQPNNVQAVVVSDGALEVYTQQVSATAPFRVLADRGHRAQKPSRAHPARSGMASSWEHLGFGYAAGSDAFGFRRVIVVPFWAIVLLIAIPPVGIAYLLRRWRAARRTAQNRCARCGYSLTGNLSGTCPECGTPVATAEPAGPHPPSVRLAGVD